MSGAKIVGGIIAAGIAWWWLTQRKPPARKQSPSSYVLIGDSLGEGLGPPLTDELKPAKLTTMAHTSANAQDWSYGKYKAELDQALASKPDVLLVSLGTNDTAGGASSSLYYNLPYHFKLIADAARGAGVKPIFIKPPTLPWSDQRIVEAVTLAGAQIVMTPGGITHAPDGIHLTMSGYSTWAKLTATALKST